MWQKVASSSSSPNSTTTIAVVVDLFSAEEGKVTFPLFPLSLFSFPLRFFFPILISSPQKVRKGRDRRRSPFLSFFLFPGNEETTNKIFLSLLSSVELGRGLLPSFLSSFFLGGSFSLIS